MDSSTAKRDALFRCLYLRREYAALQARASAQVEEQERERFTLATTTSATTTAGAASASPSPQTPASAPAAMDDKGGAAAAIPLDDLRDIILLPPHNAAMGDVNPTDNHGAGTLGQPYFSPSPVSNSGVGGGAGAGGARSIGKDPMLREEFGWSGLVFIRNLPSPWYNGCFPFTVYFPSRYPFEAPVIELGGQLRSHPHVREGRVRDLEELGVGALGASMHTTTDAIDTPLASSMTKTSASSLFSASKRYFIPFEDVYCGIDPMRVSVLSRVLQHVKRFFYPTEWPAAWQQPAQKTTTAAAASSPSEPYVNRVLARRDVDRRSATQEVVLGKPYVDYLGADVLRHFLTTWELRMGTSFASTFPSLAVRPETDEETRAVVEAALEAQDDSTLLFASWYNRSVLPHMLTLP